MVASDNSLVLVFNGEIYNQKELRSQLEKQGYLFRSECDTEVLMNGFRHWRQGVWSRINGILQRLAGRRLAGG